MPMHYTVRLSHTTHMFQLQHAVTSTTDKRDIDYYPVDNVHSWYTGDLHCGHSTADCLDNESSITVQQQ
jgi:hypothetical protein